MKMAVSALLVGASLLASAPASAADYIKFTLRGTGTYYQTTYTGTDTLYNERPNDFYAVFIAPLDSTFNTTHAKDDLGERSTSSPSPYSGTTSVTASSSGLSFSDATTYHSGSQSLSVSICGDFSSGFPTATFNVATGCGKANTFTSYANPYIVQTGFSGSIGLVEIERFTASSSPLGAVTISAIPEPATWAMMLVGFAAIGVMARRRQPVALIV